ncbi:unnamed protein product [Lathyrus sativus]|nr:unnamed protein product [Lathyrus sativus]
MIFPRREELPPSKTTDFTFHDEWIETSWGFEPALGQVSFIENVLETTIIIGMYPKTMYSRRTITIQIPVYLIISSFISGVIDRFGLLTSPLARPGLSHVSAMGGESFFHDTPKPLLDLETSLGFSLAFTCDKFTVDKLSYISTTRVPSLELDVGKGEDDDTNNPSERSPNL